MSLPLNFNLFNIGFNSSVPMSSDFTNCADSTALFNFSNIGVTNSLPYDSFSIMNEYAKIQQDYFKVLLGVLMSSSVNHIPAPFVQDNFRPYDYNKYGSSGTKISQLNPKMQEKTMQLLDYAKSIGLEVEIVSGYRTQDEQKHLQKTRPQYAAKDSLHCQGKAIDIKIKNGTHKDYKRLGDFAKSIGMRWGGDFTHPRAEDWHFDLGRK